MWSSWNIKIKNVAFKEVRPLEMEIRPEITDIEVSRGWFFSKTEEKKTGRWIIKFKYDRGPMTPARVHNVVFAEQSEARWWYNHIWENVFLKQSGPVPPPVPKKNNKITRLRKKKNNKKSHLRLV